MKVKSMLFLCSIICLVLIFGVSKFAFSQEKQIKIGAILAFTGPAVTTCKPTENAFDYVLSKAGWQVAGKKIVLIKEDEAGKPVDAVNKAKKLVQSDKVDVIFGPQLGSTFDAVAAYLKPIGIPQIHTSHVLESVLKNEHVFLAAGTNDQVGLPWGAYAHDKLNLKKAILIAQDYASAKAFLKGFADGFKARGGVIAQEIAIPFGTLDFGPYLAKLDKTADCIAFWLTGGSNISFVKQFKEYGAKMTLLGTPAFPFEEGDLAALKEHGVGMAGFGAYSPEIDTPANKKFVKEYKEKYGTYPGFAAMQAYSAMTMYLEALKMTEGDPSADKIIPAMKKIGKYNTPGGVYGMTDKRYGASDTYFLKVSKIGDRYAWKPIDKIPMQTGK